VVVATDSEAVCVAVEKAGGRAVMTAVDHHPAPTGSSRRSSISTRNGVRDRGQRAGRPADARSGRHPRGARPARRSGGRYRDHRGEIRDAAERTNPNVVKVVGSSVGERRLRALYFTRATAPHGEGPLYHHIGLYAYRRAALERFVALAPSSLEKREKLEQLRALEAGMRIDVTLVDSVPLGVDTPEELEKARALLSR